MRQRHRFGLLGQGEIERSIQMHFQQSNAPDTASIQKLPLLDQNGFLLDWQLPLQGPHDTLECLGIGIDGGIIAGEVNIHAATRQLGIDLPERTHLIRSN